MVAERDELFETDGVAGNDLLAAVGSIFDQTGIEMKTVLNPKQIVALSIALTFAEKYKIPLLTNLCQLLMELKVSDKGTGRKDLRAVLQTKMTVPRETRADRLLGQR